MEVFKVEIKNELYEVVEKAKLYDQLMKLQNSFNVIRCSFCNEGQDKVDHLIAGRNVYICNKCVDLCVNILEEGTENNL